jgi:hypothetical protein
LQPELAEAAVFALAIAEAVLVEALLAEACCRTVGRRTNQPRLQSDNLDIVFLFDSLSLLPPVLIDDLYSTRQREIYRPFL